MTKNGLLLCWNPSRKQAKNKVLAYDEQLVRNFIEEIRVFPDKLTMTVKGGAKEDITI